jgi:hypothetical protein
MENPKALQELQQRLDENYNAFVQGWLSLDAPTLIEKAEEIAVTRKVYKVLRAGHFRDMEYLLRFRNPLEVVRDQWIEEESCAPDDEMEHVLWSVSDRGDAEQDYDLDEKFRPPEQQGVKLC